MDETIPFPNVPKVISLAFLHVPRLHYVIDPVLGGSAKPDFETLFVLFGMVEVYSEVINAHLHVIRAQRLR